MKDIRRVATATRRRDGMIEIRFTGFSRLEFDPITYEPEGSSSIEVDTLIYASASNPRWTRDDR